ncbi:MAG: hypothetical protein ACMUIE_10300 [Thermoplasmatota archaeon]
MKTKILAALAIIGALALVLVVFGGIGEAKKQTTHLYYEDGYVTAILPSGGDVAFKELPENAKSYPFDPIYVFVDEDTGMPHAQTPVIGSVPGDKDYTGGRWQVFLVLGTTATDDDITSVSELMGSGLEIRETDMYFSCPVIKK